METNTLYSISFLFLTVLPCPPFLPLFTHFSPLNGFPFYLNVTFIQLTTSTLKMAYSLFIVHSLAP